MGAFSSWRVCVKVDGNLEEARFLARDNRFRVTVEVGGREVWAHLPNSGRLGELLVPGRRVTYLRNAPLHDPMEVLVGRCCLSLRHAEAALVTVEVEP